MKETGLINKWIIVYEGTALKVAQYNDGQTTACPDCCTVETFKTEELMDARITELGMERPLEESFDTEEFPIY